MVSLTFQSIQENISPDDRLAMLYALACFVERERIVPEFMASLDGEGAMFEEQFGWSDRDRFAEAEEIYGSDDDDALDEPGLRD